MDKFLKDKVNEYVNKYNGDLSYFGEPINNFSKKQIIAILNNILHGIEEQRKSQDKFMHLFFT